MALTTLMTNLMLGAFFNNGTHWLGLHVTDPTTAGLASTELSSVTIPTYSRKQITWTAPANRSVVNTAAVQWTSLPVVEIGYLGVWSAQTGGDLLAVLVCREPLLVGTAGASIYCPAGSLAVVIGGSPEQRATQLTTVTNTTVPGSIPPVTPGNPPSAIVLTVS